MTNSGPLVFRKGLSGRSKMGGNAPKCPAICGSVLHFFSLFVSVLSTAGFAVVLCFVFVTNLVIGKFSEVKKVEDKKTLEK